MLENSKRKVAKIFKLMDVFVTSHTVEYDYHSERDRACQRYGQSFIHGVYWACCQVLDSHGCIDHSAEENGNDIKNQKPKPAPTGESTEKARIHATGSVTYRKPCPHKKLEREQK